MPQPDYVTQTEFDALEARVSALEQGQQPPQPEQPPETEPPPGGATDGVQATRVHQLIELLGVNTFSSLDEHNVWGSWPADYRPESVIAGLRYITGDTRFCLGIREYHYAGRESFQTPWLEQIRTAFPAAVITVCVGANGSAGDVASLVTLPHDYAEGLNEPNTDFGSGQVPVDTTLAIQDAVWAQDVASRVMGPSIVAGMPHPEGWITGYCGDRMGAINGAMSIGNGHYYPPHCPDLTGDGTSLSEYVGGLWTAYAQHPIAITEFHPSLYNADGHGPSEPGWDGQRDAYYTLLALLRARKCTVVGLWWYAMFDYGQTYQCGLFPQRGAENPRPAATALRNLCTICRDDGADLRSFTPGKLTLLVDIPDSRCDWDLYQASDGRFLLALWKSCPEPGGDLTPIAISFATPSRVVEYDPLRGTNAVHQEDATTTFIAMLDGGVRVLVIANA